MAEQSGWMRFGNDMMTWVLRSPLHGLAGRSLLITVTGRKSGAQYTFPVNYTRSGDVITILSRRDRTWWRNLRGGASVTLHVDGKDVQGQGTVIEDDAEVAKALQAYTQTLSRVPRRLRDTAAAVHTYLIIQVQLTAQAASSVGY
ncbi:MAG: nitroreductase/quinone reductase family protein [Anaerolineae bacterium]